jgi:Concanavalin A-like lectin/glucanases superfamily/Putative Ig domain
MSKARDIANILSANTAIATDAEVTAAISTATSGLATSSSVSTAVTNERTATATLTNKTIDGNLNVINVKRGTTAERPNSATAGDQYYDTTLNALYNYTSAGWVKVSQDPAPAIISISPTVAPVAGTSITINGSGFKSGALVKFIGNNGTEYSATSVTVTSLALMTAVTPQLSVANEPYSVKVTNVDNQYGIANAVLDAGGTPSWVTASGNIKTLKENTALSATSVSATDPDGTAIIYSSSNLPAWASLNSSTGAITGTTPSVSSSTTYSFDITASDGTNTSSRAFNIVVQPNVVLTNLVTHLDASNSSSYSGSGSTWFDISGNGNNATLYNGVSYSTSGSGGHLSLDGSNGYIQLASNSSAAPYANQTFTIDMWVYRYAETDGYEILWSQDYTSHTPPYYSVHIRIDNPSTMGIMGGGNSGQPSGVVSTGVWQHWVFTRDLTDVNIYRNGISISTAGTGTSTTYYNNPLWIGKSNFNSSSTLNFGSVRYYNRKLSATEVLKNFDASKARFGL